MTEPSEMAEPIKCTCGKEADDCVDCMKDYIRKLEKENARLKESDELTSRCNKQFYKRMEEMAEELRVGQKAVKAIKKAMTVLAMGYTSREREAFAILKEAT